MVGAAKLPAGPSVSSISFYPDFIQILYPDFVHILYPDFIQILSKFLKTSGYNLLD